MPPNLREIDFQIAYGARDDRVNDFYIPALSCSVRYDRSAGFFSSSALAVAAAGVARLIANGGRMRLLVGAQISEDDVRALHGGTGLADVVAGRMTADLEEVTDAIARERLAAMAWMIQKGNLEVRVVLPKGDDGYPLPGGICSDYYHPKTGIFTDAEGNQVVFAGSINESAGAWLSNYEVFSVYCSWRRGVKPYVTTHRDYFERLWEGREDGWIGLAVPDAVRQKLIRYAPAKAPAKDPLEKEARPEPPKLITAEERERIIFQFLKDAPFLPNGRYLGQVATTVDLWPHQKKVVNKVFETYPRRYMLCDEVGLGKTLEGGGIVKQLTLTGRVRRCLILAPKSVCRQWQEELYEKFLLNVPIYDGSDFKDYFERELPYDVKNPWNAFPLIIASSQLAKRQDRAEVLYRAEPWDLVLIDEAHHARRKDFLANRYRRNRLLSLLLGAQDDPNDRGLVTKTDGLVLITATPMQIDPREVWDLLTVVGLGGRWGASDEDFVRFFEEVRQGANANWRFLLSMVRDYLDHGGEIDGTFAETAENRVGLVTWETIRKLPYDERIGPVISQLDESGQAVLLEFIRRHTPLSRYVFRNTRELLREYQKRGLLGDEIVPYRKPELVWVAMREEERRLYDRIEEYISEFYKKYEAERVGLGFVMTVYRRRLTSSFYAMAESLKRRLRFLRGEPDVSAFAGLTEEDFEEDDLNRDVLEKLSGVDRSIYLEELAYVEDFISQLKNLGVDSKVEQLQEELADLLRRRETVIVITLYTDTMDYLRDQLRSVYGNQVACYSGRGGEIWDGRGWKRVPKETVKADFKEEKIKILLGTDALSEGLNLQTCGVLVNYDMPWNPMRVEQRIGRIDRIGQRYEEVWVKNYFYEDTVEANVYRALQGRINWFETVVGDLQPILARVARIIQEAAMQSGVAREKLLEQEIESLKQDMERRELDGLDFGSYIAQRVEAPAEESPPVRQSDIERTLLRSGVLKGNFLTHSDIAGAYELSIEGINIPLTFDRRLFDEHPNTLRFVSYGEELFDKLLAVGAADEKVSLPPWITRVFSDEPKLCMYFAASGSGFVALTDLKSLEGALDREGPPFDEELNEAVGRIFREEIRTVEESTRITREDRRTMEEFAVREKARRLLLHSTYVDLAMSASAGLFNETSNVTGFSEEAVKKLRRHGYPFAPLIRLVGTEGINPVPTDPFYEEIRNESYDRLQKRFEAIKSRVVELIPKLSIE